MPKLNKANLYKWERKFAAKEEKLPVKFDIQNWLSRNTRIEGGHICGTSACIGGHVFLEQLRRAEGTLTNIETKFNRGELSGTDFLIAVIKEFGIDRDTARELCLPHRDFWFCITISYITKKAVANALRHLRIHKSLPEEYSQCEQYYKD